MMNISDANVNTRDFWEKYFRQNWEQNNGRNQTRLFAECFINSCSLPKTARTLLDVGCGMGDAIPVICNRYPHLKCCGCDVSTHALGKASAAYGSIASFHNWNFEDIQGHYDIIYCSNVLEHFETYLDIVRGLLKHCIHLYVMVPYLELSNGQRLKVEANQQHVVTYDKHSFDILKVDNSARRIKHLIQFAPGAWGNGPIPRLTKMKLFLRGRPQIEELRQIIFHIQSAHSHASLIHTG